MPTAADTTQAGLAAGTRVLTWDDSGYEHRGEVLTSYLGRDGRRRYLVRTDGGYRVWQLASNVEADPASS
jgi:hypothetical protein